MSAAAVVTYQFLNAGRILRQCRHELPDARGAAAWTVANPGLTRFSNKGQQSQFQRHLCRGIKAVQTTVMPI